VDVTVHRILITRLALINKVFVMMLIKYLWHQDKAMRMECNSLFQKVLKKSGKPILITRKVSKCHR